MSEAPEWPREIWMAERNEHDQGVVMAVLSEHATVARFAGDKERDRDFHKYIDADIYDSAERYWKEKAAAHVAAERERCASWAQDIADCAIDLPTERAMNRLAAAIREGE